MIAEEIKDTILDISKPHLDVEDLYQEICGISINKLNFIYIGKYSYIPIWELQKKLHEAVKECKIGNVILFLEHDHVYTFGKNADEDFLLNSYPKDVEVVHSDRGGQVTYHGPGQLVGYPIINLNDFKKSVSWYMRSLENVIINSLNDIGIKSNTKESMTGVWVDDEKICAMGVRLSRWVTMHGFALNLKPNMSFYDTMIPCGIQEYGITCVNDFIKKELSLFDASRIITKNFIRVFRDYSEEI